MKKNFERILLLIYIVFIVTIAKITPDIFVNYNKRQKILKECSDIQKKIELENQKILDFEKKIEVLDDEFQREKIVRDKLKMIKENEEIYRFINK